MTESPTTIVIVDRSEIVRRGLRALFHAQSDLHVIADCATAEEATAQVGRLQPDVLVMDALLPDGSGSYIYERIRIDVPGVRVVSLVGSAEERVVVAAVRAGAVGVVSKRAPLIEICQVVRAAARGDSLLDSPSTTALLAHVRRQPVRPDVGEALTDVERRVLALVADGRTNREIAEALSTGEKTVKTHLARAFTKLHVTRRAHAAVLFVGEGRGAEAGHRTEMADDAPPVVHFARRSSAVARRLVPSVAHGGHRLPPRPERTATLSPPGTPRMM